jgi:hypothetical protein
MNKRAILHIVLFAVTPVGLSLALGRRGQVLFLNVSRILVAIFRDGSFLGLLSSLRSLLRFVSVRA